MFVARQALKQLIQELEDRPLTQGTSCHSPPASTLWKPAQAPHTPHSTLDTGGLPVMLGFGVHASAVAPHSSTPVDATSQFAGASDVRTNAAFFGLGSVKLQDFASQILELKFELQGVQRATSTLARALLPSTDAAELAAGGAQHGNGSVHAAVTPSRAGPRGLYGTFAEEQHEEAWVIDTLASLQVTCGHIIQSLHACVKEVAPDRLSDLTDASDMPAAALAAALAAAQTPTHSRPDHIGRGMSDGEGLAQRAAAEALREARAQCEEYEGRIARLQARLDSALADLVAARDEAGEADARRNAAEVLLQESEERAAAASSALSLESEARGKAQARADAAEAEAAEAMAAMAAARGQAAAAQEEAAAAAAKEEAARVEAQAEAGKLMAEVQALQSQLQAVQAQLLDAQAAAKPDDTMAEASEGGSDHDGAVGGLCGKPLPVPTTTAVRMASAPRFRMHPSWHP